MEDGRGWCNVRGEREPFVGAEADGYDLRPEALNAAIDQVQAVLNAPEIDGAAVVAFRRICVGLCAASAENLKLRAELVVLCPPPIVVGSIWYRKLSIYDEVTVIGVWALPDGRPLVELKRPKSSRSEVEIATTFRAEWTHQSDP